MMLIKLIFKLKIQKIVKNIEIIIFLLQWFKKGNNLQINLDK